MLIGVGRIIFDFYNNDSLAVKHRHLDELCHDLRKKYNLSVLEIADFDDLERGVIGFAAAIPETWKSNDVRKFLEKICKTIDSSAPARVTVEDVDILSHG